MTGKVGVPAPARARRQLIHPLGGHRPNQVLALAERARRAEADREQRDRQAAAKEPARIARELHDVIAHSVSVMVRQAEGGRYVAAKDPAAAATALATIAETGRTALTDMRSLLGVLDAGRAATGTDPQPTLDDLPDLLERVRASEQPVRLRVEGTPQPMDRAAHLAAYRLVQEAPTNVVKHAGPDVGTEVALTWTPRALRLEVTDSGGRSPSTAGAEAGGRGLAGMRERLLLVGGRLSAGRSALGVSRWSMRSRRRRRERSPGGTGDRSGDPRRPRRRPGAGPHRARHDRRRAGGHAVVGEAADGSQALDVVAGTPCDVVLMDVRMPRMDGVAATRQLLHRFPDGPRVLVLTTFDLDEHAFAALRAGASGFLLKDAPAEDVLAAIRTVHAGDAVIAPSTTRRLLDHVAADLPVPAGQDDVLDTLTAREREVMTEIARGATNAEIAARLYLAEPTVKTHVGRILAKLGLRDRVHIVIRAYETGLVRRGGS